MSLTALCTNSPCSRADTSQRLGCNYTPLSAPSLCPGEEKKEMERERERHGRKRRGGKEEIRRSWAVCVRLCCVTVVCANILMVHATPILHTPPKNPPSKKTFHPPYLTPHASKVLTRDIPRCAFIGRLSPWQRNEHRCPGPQMQSVCPKRQTLG